MNIVACMGGWCAVRDRCAHYYVISNIRSERLCAKREDNPLGIRPGSLQIELDDEAERAMNMALRRSVRIIEEEKASP